MQFIKPILNLLGIGADVLKAKSDLKVKQIEARAQTAQTNADWEAVAAQNAATSWLDEWWTFVLSMPLICAFVPWVRPYIAEGFEALKIVPEWYVWAVLASISFAFARKRMPDLSAWLTRNKA